MKKLLIPLALLALVMVLCPAQEAKAEEYFNLTVEINNSSYGTVSVNGGASTSYYIMMT